MRTYSCDRCKRKFAQSGPDDPPPKHADTSIANGLTTKLPVLVGKDRDQVEFREFDLCPKCIREFHAWMNGTK